MGTVPFFSIGLLDFVVRDQPGEVLERTIVGRLGICGKETCRQLPRAKVPLDALAADPLPRTRIIGAVAVFQVFGFLAFHDERFHFRQKA
jgi:hypothetical protein